jgi:hypothetical protein
MRSVLTKDDVELLERQGKAPASGTKTDDYTEQIAKNIPIEVVSFYTGVFALVSASAGNAAAASVGYTAFVVSLIGTVLYSWLKNKTDNVPNVEIKVGMATLAFAIWAYTIWWPFASYVPQNELVGGFLVLAYLFASPLVYQFITVAQLNYFPPKPSKQTTTPPPSTS